MSRWDNAEGANAVEFALVLPVLIMLVFGLVSVGLLWNQQLTLTQAAREGARFAATLPADTFEGTCAAGNYGDPDSWCSQVRTRTLNASGGALGDNNIDAISYTSADREVRVALTREGRLEIVITPPWTPTLSAEAVARYEH